MWHKYPPNFSFVSDLEKDMKGYVQNRCTRNLLISGAVIYFPQLSHNGARIKLTLKMTEDFKENR